MGKLIVFEGIDGSGKSSQYNLVCKKLNEEGVSFNHIVFPRYEKETSSLIRMYLNGGFGPDPDAVGAYAASTFFAVDRCASYADDWGKKYEAGELILSDRYTTSNAVHQGSKLSDDELPAFFAWLADLEYNKMRLPQPDLVIYLDTDISTSLKRMRTREQLTGSHADIHESNTAYLERCLHTADFACNYYQWKRIAFLDSSGNERSIEDKNEEIYFLIKDNI